MKAKHGIRKAKYDIDELRRNIKHWEQNQADKTSHRNSWVKEKKVI